MSTNRRVLIIGFDPNFLDFSSPELAPMNLTPEKVLAGTQAEIQRLRSLGYDANGCFIDLGETAEHVVASHLQAGQYSCVVIGAGVRVNPKFFLLFERVLNVVHAYAPMARIAFNTRPTDTVEAVQRWL